MIRKIFMLVIVTLVFMYMAWNFYSEAISYDPLSEVSVKKFKPRESDIILLSKYKPAWTKEIYEKNLFSSSRTHIKQKHVPVENIPPVESARRPELSLMGIVLDAFGDYVAYIEIDKSKPIPMRKGDKTEDIELIDVSERKVVLKWSLETIHLSLEKIKMINKSREIK